MVDRLEQEPPGCFDDPEVTFAVLGFSDKIHIEKNNICICDTLEYAKNGTMETEMKKLFEL